MARDAQGPPVAHVKAQLREERKGLDVISLQYAPALPAELARVVIPIENSLTPVAVLGRHAHALIGRRDTLIAVCREASVAAEAGRVVASQTVSIDGDEVPALLARELDS
jgi:hypothetical protein